MADLSITITNTLDFFGPSQPTIWNAFTWGTPATWGQSSDFGTVVVKVIDSTVTPASDMVKYAYHVIDSATSLDSSVSSSYTIVILNTLSILIDMASETLRDSRGYNYLYPDNATNAESRDPTTWGAATSSAATYASVSATTTSWSAA